MNKASIAIAASLSLLLPAPAALALVPPDANETTPSVTLAAKKKAKKGKLRVRIAGLPGKSANVRVKGPKKYKRTLASSATMKVLRPGTYKVTASPVFVEAAAYKPVVRPRTKVKIKPGKTTSVTVAYTRQGQSAPTNPPSAPPSAQGEPVRFNLSNAVALAKKDSTSASAQKAVPSGAAVSNLAVVSADGTTRNALVSGSLQIREFYIAPNDQIYIFLDSPINLETSEYQQDGCLLLRVTQAEEKPACVDSTLRAVGLYSGNQGNPQIQFDASGAIYYAGVTADNKTVLRKNNSGNITDIVNDNIYLSTFIVAPDGSVYLSGWTQNTGGPGWTRRLSPQGRLSTLATYQTNWLKLLADGNVYFPDNYDRYMISRYLVTEERMDPRPWIDFPQGAPDLNAHYYCEALFTAAGFGGCHTGWVTPVGLFNTIDGQSIGAIGKGSGYYGADQTGFLLRIVPTPEFVTTAIAAPTVALSVMDTLLLAGMKVDNTFTLVAFDTGTDTERELLDAAQEVEIYHLAFSGSTNRVMFDGLRFSDNKFVIGSVDMGTGEVNMTPSSAKLSDFQAL